MKNRKNYKRRSALSRRIIASSLSATFFAGTISGGHVGAMNMLIDIPDLSNDEIDIGIEDLDTKIKNGEIFTKGCDENKLNLIKKTYLKFKSVFPGTKEILKLVFNYLSEDQLDSMIQKFPQYLSDENFLFQIVRAHNSGEDLLRFLFNSINNGNIENQQRETLKDALFYNESLKEEIQEILKEITLEINVDESIKKYVEDLVNKNKDFLLSKMPSKGEFLKLFVEEEKFSAAKKIADGGMLDKLEKCCPDKAQILSAVVETYFVRACDNEKDVDARWEYFCTNPYALLNDKTFLEDYIKERIDAKSRFKQFFYSLESILNSKDEKKIENESKVNIEDIEKMNMELGDENKNKGEDDLLKSHIFLEKNKLRLLNRKNVIFIIGAVVVLLLIIGGSIYLTRDNNVKEICSGSGNDSGNEQINNQDTSPVAQKSGGGDSESGQISGEGSDIFERATYTVIGSSLGVGGAFLDDKISEHNAKGVKKVKNAQDSGK